MHDGLMARGFKQSAVDMCVHHQDSVALMICTDDGIFIGPDKAQIDECHESLTRSVTDKDGTVHRAFVMTDEGCISDHLGVKITDLKNGAFKLHQPQLINSVLRDLAFIDEEGNSKTKVQRLPASVSIVIPKECRARRIGAIEVFLAS